MAQTDLVNRRCLDLKLEVLEQQRKHSHEAVDGLVQNVLSLAEKWKDNQEGKPEIYELLQTIDRAVELLDLKCVETIDYGKTLLRRFTGNVVEQINVEKQCDQNSSHEVDKDSAFEALQSETLNLFKKLEERLNKNDTKVERINANIKEVKTMKTEVPNIKKQLLMLSENLNQLQAQTISRVATDENTSSLASVLRRTNSMEEAATDLSARILRSEDYINAIFIEQERCAAEIDEIVKKFVDERDEKLEGLQKQVEESNENYECVCQLLVTRLKPLEQLQQALNKRCQTKDDNVAKLLTLGKEVAIISPKIDKLEMQLSQTVVGFTAGASLSETVATNSVISLYSSVYCNVGGHFNALSGIFTVPCDGTYVVSITLMCPDLKDVLEVNVLCRDVLDPKVAPRTVCWAVSTTDAARPCDLGLIEMKTGETLFCKVVHQSYVIRAGRMIRLSCFRIG